MVVRRNGVSTVEFAFVAPIIFLVLLALIQFAGLSMQKNVLTAAAREGGRVASLPSTVSENTVTTSVREFLQRGGIDPDLVTVEVTPTTLSDTSSGDELRVTVSAPLREMGWIWVISPPNSNLTAEITCDRE